MPTLTRTRTIVTRCDPDDEGDRRYWAVDEESGVIRRTLYMDIETFQDLGEPAEVTLTIEPGDLLNN